MPTSFQDIIDKLDANELWDFPGGVHPPQFKQLSNQQAIETLPLPKRLYIPAKQHIGVEGHIIVQVGQHVLKGQALSKSMNPFAVPIHAPTSGTIVSIGQHVSAHPSGLPELTIELEADMQDTWIGLNPISDYQNQPKMTVLGAICDAGIAGMGSASFPTHIKSSPKKNVEFLIINGIECEPYISSDDRLMREHAWQIRQGIDVLSHILSPKMVLVGIEDNKPEAIEAMTIACRDNPHIRICSIPTKYPAGGEKQLIQVLTNREVPSGGLPIDVGVIMHNVGTCFAIADAIFSGKPLVQRVVTVTGQAVNKRGNYWALIGTPVDHLLAHSDYQANKQPTPNAIMGGPMMGFTIADPQVPVVKTTNCILVPDKHELAGSLNGSQEQACIRCSACADACPVSLLPQQLLWHAKAKELDKAQEYNLFDCIECGACAYVCPSEIPLVHYYRIAKADVRIEQQEKQKADKARERFESRAARLQEEQQAREEKHRLAAEARKQAMAQSGNDAQDKIAAALARAKAKKHAQADDSPAANSSEQVASAQTADNPVSSNDRVQAAIARAKAKKAAQADNESDAPTPAPSAQDVSEQPEQRSDAASEQTSSPNPRVQAAIARAKAKKAAQADNDSGAQTPAPSAQDVSEQPEQQIDVASEQTSSPNPRVQAAIARAKAKKAAAEAALQADAPAVVPEASEVEPTDNSQTGHADTAEPQAAESPAQLAKQKRIAAAVAKAKAKKAQSEAVQSADSTSEHSIDESVPPGPAGADSAQINTATDDTAQTDTQALDDKKRRIAEAVAKAKAKKRAAQQQAKDESQ